MMKIRSISIRMNLKFCVFLYIYIFLMNFIFNVLEKLKHEVRTQKKLSFLFQNKILLATLNHEISCTNTTALNTHKPNETYDFFNNRNIIEIVLCEFID